MEASDPVPFTAGRLLPLRDLQPALSNGFVYSLVVLLSPIYMLVVGGLVGGLFSPRPWAVVAAWSAAAATLVVAIMCSRRWLHRRQAKLARTPAVLAVGRLEQAPLTTRDRETISFDAVMRIERVPGKLLLLDLGDRMIILRDLDFLDSDALERVLQAVESSMSSRPEADALQREQRSRQAIVADIRHRRALATYSLLILIALAFGAEMMAGALDKPTELVRLGGNAPALVREGQWWRLVTAGLLHASFLHLYMNGTALASIGLVVEKLIGSSRFLIIFLSASVMGHLASAWHASAMVSVGASAGIFGLLGALLVVQIVERKNLPMALVVPPRRWIFLIGINVFISLMPGVDFWAHLGGFITGAVLAAMLSADVDVQDPRGSAEVRVVAATVTLACCFAVGFALWRGAATADLVETIKSLGEVPWLRCDLPGFALELPPGTVDKKQFDYGSDATKVVSLREGRTVVVRVAWKYVGAMPMDTSNIKKTAAIMAASQDGGGNSSAFELPGPDGAIVPAVEIVSARGTMNLAMLRCGTRAMTLTVVDNQSPKPWLQRLVAGFKCQPDSAKEAQLSRQVGFPLSLDLPGWYATTQFPVEVILQDGRGHSLILLQGAAWSEDALKNTLNTALGLTGLTMDSATRLVDRTTFGITGDLHAVGWYRQINCGPALSIVVMGIAPTAQEADDLFKITASATCIAPGEVGQIWPNAPYRAPITQ